MNRLLVGERVECTVCHRTKKPNGRDSAGDYCRGDECFGWGQEPYVGDLWPGERREDFGYPPALAQVAEHVTKLREMLRRTADELEACAKNGPTSWPLELAGEVRALLKETP